MMQCETSGSQIQLKSLCTENPDPREISSRMKEEVEKSIGEECIQEEELKNLLSKKAAPICYDGFEPSGRMHIAQGLMKVINVNKLTSAGCRVKIWIADWFAQLNHKVGGDLDKIQVFGEYFIEVWKAAGMNQDKVEFLWSSKEINAAKCGQIMGRSDSDELSPAQILYPCMQCAYIFFLEADICRLGMDQRKVNMLAREYCDVIKRKNKPIILSHHMLPGLLEGQEKMSKSNRLSAIFMEDKEADVNEKIENAYCPLNIVEGNPCLEYIKYIILPWFDEFTVVERNELNGGNKTYKNFVDIAAEYESGKLHPGDLKEGLTKALNKICNLFVIISKMTHTPRICSKRSRLSKLRDKSYHVSLFRQIASLIL